MKKQTLTKVYPIRLNRELLNKVEAKIDPTELRLRLKKINTNYLKRQL